MAPRNSMRTKMWSFEKTTFPLKFGQNSRGGKPRSGSQRRYEPDTKTIWKAESMEDIVPSLFDFSNIILIGLNEALNYFNLIAHNVHFDLKWELGFSNT